MAQQQEQLLPLVGVVVFGYVALSLGVRVIGCERNADVAYRGHKVVIPVLAMGALA